MTRLNWNESAPRYELGVDRGVYFPQDGPGVAWNGLVGVSESPLESESRPRYRDGVRIGNRQTPGTFAGEIQAFSFPKDTEDDIFSVSRRNRFGFSYRNETQAGHRIHLVYNARLSPSQMDYRYLESDPFSWSFSTIPVSIPNGSPTSHLVVDTAMTSPAAVSTFEDIIYGSDYASPRLPGPVELHDIFEENSILIVTDHGNGLVTVTGPDEALYPSGTGLYTIDWPSLVRLNENTFSIRSM